MSDTRVSWKREAALALFFGVLGSIFLAIASSMTPGPSHPGPWHEEDMMLAAAQARAREKNLGQMPASGPAPAPRQPTPASQGIPSTTTSVEASLRSKTVASSATTSGEGITPIAEVRTSIVRCFEPKPGSPAIGEPCSSQRLRARLLEQRQDLEACLTALPEERRGAHGRVTVRGRWSMGDPPSGGKLVSVRPGAKTPKDPALLSCIRQVLGKLTVTAGVCPTCYAEMGVTLLY